jgi:hypothetical protein
MAKKRQIPEEEKKQVIEMQKSPDGSIRCYISGDVLDLEKDEVEYDHIIPFSSDGPTEINNIRVFRKKFNKEKGKMSLLEYKDYFALKRLYENKQNKVKLQDIFSFKNVTVKSINISKTNDELIITDGNQSLKFPLLKDSKLNINYFYGQLPISWIQNDDQQGLQPRVIDFKRLYQIKKHLEDYPQLAPSIARLLKNEIRLFDGQHKLAAQSLNNSNFVDVKVYLTPDDETQAKIVYEKLLKTNLEAHSKLAQVSFYTNTLFQKWNEMYAIKWEEYVEQNPGEKHSEKGFFDYLVRIEAKPDAKKMFDATIIKNVHDESSLKKFTAESNKDPNLPLSQDLLQKTLFKHTLYLTPSLVEVESELDFRDSEKENFQILSDLLVSEGFLNDWTPNKKDNTPKHQKARRIWTKASVLTWAPYLNTMINAIFKLFDPSQQDKNLYRSKMNDAQKEEFRLFLNRLFNHPFWLQNDATIDKALGAATNVKAIFEKQGLTTTYILNGQ